LLGCINLAEIVAFVVYATWEFQGSRENPVVGVKVSHVTDSKKEHVLLVQ
jgi:hypothetical protein